MDKSADNNFSLKSYWLSCALALFSVAFIMQQMYLFFPRVAHADQVAQQLVYTRDILYTQSEAGINPSAQATAEGFANDADWLRKSLKCKGWKGSPIDAVRFRDAPPGKVTALDNTRPGVAAELGMDQIPVHIHDELELLNKKGVKSLGSEIRKVLGEDPSRLKSLSEIFGADPNKLRGLRVGEIADRLTTLRPPTWGDFARVRMSNQSLDWIKANPYGATPINLAGTPLTPEEIQMPCPKGGVVEPPPSPCKNLPKATIDPAALRGQTADELFADLERFSDPLAPQQYNPENVGIIRDELVNGRNGINDLESRLSQAGRDVRGLSLSEQRAAFSRLSFEDQNILRQIFDIEYELNSDQVTAALEDLKRCAPPPCVAEKVSAEVAAQIAEAARLSKQLTQAQEALKAARLKHIEYISQFVGGGPDPGMGRGPGMGFAPDQAELQRLRAAVAEAEGRVAQLGEQLKPLEEVLVNIGPRSGVVGSAGLPKLPVAAEVGATVAGELSWASRLARVVTVRGSVDFFFELFLGRFTLYGFIIHDLVMWEINYWSNVIEESYYNDAIRNAELRLVFLETTVIQRWNRYLATLRTEAEIAQCTGLVINTAYDDLLTLYILRGKIHNTLQDIMNVSIAYDIQHDKNWNRTLELIEGVIAKKYVNFPDTNITGPALDELKDADRKRMTNREWNNFVARRKIDWLGGGEGMNVVLPEKAKKAKYVNEVRRQLSGPPIGDDLWSSVFDGNRKVLDKVIADAVKAGKAACEEKKKEEKLCEKKKGGGGGGGGRRGGGTAFPTGAQMCAGQQYHDVARDRDGNTLYDGPVTPLFLPTGFSTIASYPPVLIGGDCIYATACCTQGINGVCLPASPYKNVWRAQADNGSLTTLWSCDGLPRELRPRECSQPDFTAAQLTTICSTPSAQWPLALRDRIEESGGSVGAGSVGTPPTPPARQPGFTRGGNSSRFSPGVPLITEDFFKALVGFMLKR